jgi:hypothetical protein
VAERQSGGQWLRLVLYSCKTPGLLLLQECVRIERAEIMQAYWRGLHCVEEFEQRFHSVRAT